MPLCAPLSVPPWERPDFTTRDSIRSYHGANLVALVFVWVLLVQNLVNLYALTILTIHYTQYTSGPSLPRPRPRQM